MSQCKTNLNERVKLDRKAEVQFCITVEGKSQSAAYWLYLYFWQYWTVTSFYHLQLESVPSFQMYSQFFYNSCFENVNSQQEIIWAWCKYAILLYIILLWQKTVTKNYSQLTWLHRNPQKGGLSPPAHTQNTPQTCTSYFSPP